MRDQVRAFYARNPVMVSSPFGGVDGVDRDLLLKVFEALGIELHGLSVLDVGCGRGYFGEVVTESGGDYTGVDFVASRGGFRLALADALRLPFPDEAFGGVFCVDAFEHFPDPDAAAAEFRRVLGPSGFVFLSAPNYSNVAGIVKTFCEMFGGYERDTWAPFRNWQLQELEKPLTGRWVRRSFRNAGFTKFRRLGHGAEVSLGLFPWTDHAKMPEAVKFRLQRLFRGVGPAIVRVWPGASLHGFWKIEV